MSDCSYAPQGTTRYQPVIDFTIPPQGLTPATSEPAFGFKTGSFDKSTNTSTPVSQSVTGIGFTPKLLVLLCSQTTAQDTTVDHYITAHGMTDGTTEVAVWTGSEDNQATSDAGRFGTSAKVLTLRDPTSATFGDLLAECDITSLDSDGFTLSWTTNNAVAYKIQYWAWGGTDISTDVFSFDSATTTGSQSVSTNLNTADFTMLMSANLTTEDSITAHAQYSYGMAISSTEEGNMAFGNQDGVTTTNTYRYQEDDSVITILQNGSSNIASEADFTNHTASGFDINWSTNDGSAYKIYGASIKGGTWDYGVETTPNTTNGNQSYTTAFQPEGLIISTFTRATAATMQPGNVRNLSAHDGTTGALMSAVDMDGQASVSNSGSRSSTSDMIVSYTNPAATAEIATFDSFNATDFTLTYSGSDATQREFVWIVCKA